MIAIRAGLPAAIAGMLLLGGPTSATNRIERDVPPPPNVESLLQHLDDLYRSTSSIARIEIRAITPRMTRSMRVKAWTRGEEK